MRLWMTEVFSLQPAESAFEDWAPPLPLVFASPHSGDGYPADMGARADLTPLSLRSAEDALVDRLLEGCAGLGAPFIRGLVGRAYVDLNRGAEEWDSVLIDQVGGDPFPLSPRARAGYGVVPRLTGDGAALYERRLSAQEVQDRIRRVHIPYHRMLERLMTAARARHGFAILVDWHSMPSRAATREGGMRPLDVILGDRHGGACAPEIMRQVEMLFGKAGWRVGRNQPYAGGYATQLWGRPDEGFHAVQVELNRALYLDETRLEPGVGFARARSAVRRACAGLAAYPWRLAPGQKKTAPEGAVESR